MKNLLIVLLIIVSGSINASAQKPFYKQVNERIEYLQKMDIEVTNKSICYWTGLKMREVELIRAGLVQPKDKDIDTFCDALLCSFSLDYVK